MATKESAIWCVTECVCVLGVQYTSFWDIWAVRHQSSMSGLASHTTNGSFMTSVSSLRDHNAIKQHATLNRKQPVASLARWRFDTSDLDFQYCTLVKSNSDSRRSKATDLKPEVTNVIAHKGGSPDTTITENSWRARSHVSTAQRAVTFLCVPGSRRRQKEGKRGCWRDGGYKIERKKIKVMVVKQT